MTDLVAWLRERLDEDERVARSAREGFFQPETLSIFAAVSDAAHVITHDPARVLRQVAAHRRILDEYEQTVEYYATHRAAPAGELHGLLFAVKAIASIYSDHPGYDTAWSLDATAGQDR